MAGGTSRGKYKEAVYYSPQYKMGVKVLDETQMENIFPAYENLLKRIEEHRSHIGVYGFHENNLDEQYNLMFDNVFSIMGKRGSGKTSVVYTLKKIFEDRKETDVVLPIIMSELIPESSEIIGWILSLLENTVQNITSRLEEGKCREGMFRDCMVKTRRSLKESYNDIKELCFSRSYTGASEDSFSRIVANSERKTQNSFDFSHRIAGFWAELRKGIRVANGLEEKEEPLIYIIFDDVDLAPEKVWELLSTIVKYLSHPNVVVLVTADEEMLYEVVKNILYSKVKSGDIDQELKASPSWFREMAKLYVDKILPPSTRFYIENFETCGRKASFVAQLEFENNGEIIRQIRLKEFLEDQVDDYLKHVKSKNVGNDFLHYQGKFLGVYLLFWGDTSRQLGNECLIVNQLMDNLKNLYRKYKSRTRGGNKNRVGFFDELYHIVYYFVFSTLNANSNAVLLREEIKGLTDELLLFQPEDWGIYINYRYLQDRFNYEFRNLNASKENLDGGEREEDSEFDLLKYVKENIMLYLLLFFVENLLVETEYWFDSKFDNRRKRVHGRHDIVAMLDTITPQDYSLVRCDGDSLQQKFLYEYSKILENPELLNRFDMMSESRVRKYFDSLPEEFDVQQEAYHYCVNNPNWFRTMVKAIYLKKTGIYKVTKVALTGLSMDRIRKIHDRGIDFLDRGEIDLMCSCLENVEELVSGMVPGDDMLQEPDSSCVLGEDWRQCSTIMELKAFVETKMNQKLDIVKGIRTYYSLLCNMSRGKYENMIASIKQAGVSSGIDAVTTQIMNLMNEFTYYRIIDKDSYDVNIKEVEMMTGIWYNGREIKKDNDVAIDIEYMNSLLRTVFMKSLSEEKGYWFGRQEQLNSCYTKLRGELELFLSEEKDKEKALYMILLKELRMYMKCYDLMLFFLREREQEGMRSDPGRVSIPYKGFFSQIMRISGKSVEKKNSNTEKDETEANAVYMKELIIGYIREGVRQYVSGLLGENL